MKRRIFIALALLCFGGVAVAQQVVQTQPLATNSINASGSISSTNAFQSIFTASTLDRGRTSCTVQNNSIAGNNMFVFFGPLATATSPTSVQLTPGQAVNCTVGGIVLKDQVSITGTTGDQFFAAQQ